MKFATALSFLIATGSMVSALPSDQNEVALQDKVKEIANSGKTQGASHDGEKNSECIPPLLCCGTLTTPLDPLLDPILLSLGIDAAKIVGSIGLLCRASGLAPVFTRTVS